jgi:hypothetical protein
MPLIANRTLSNIREKDGMATESWDDQEYDEDQYDDQPAQPKGDWLFIGGIVAVLLITFCGGGFIGVGIMGLGLVLSNGETSSAAQANVTPRYTAVLVPTPLPTFTSIPTETPTPTSESPVDTPVPSPTDTPLPPEVPSPEGTASPTPEPTPAETPVPPEPTNTPVSAEPTVTPEPTVAPIPEVAYKIVHYKVLGDGENNGGIFDSGGQHLIFLTVLDANGNGVDGAVVRDDNGSSLEVVTGTKGPGKAEITMDWEPYKLYVAADPGGATTSEVSNQMNTAYPHIPDVVGKLGSLDNEYSVCPTQDVRCEPPFYSVHFSYEITFQKVN